MKRKPRSGIFWFLLKLLLLSSLYFHHNVKAISTGLPEGIKVIYFLIIYISSLNDNHLDASSGSGNSENLRDRIHRPARLLPFRHFLYRLPF